MKNFACQVQDYYSLEVCAWSHHTFNRSDATPLLFYSSHFMLNIELYVQWTQRH